MDIAHVINQASIRHHASDTRGLVWAAAWQNALARFGLRGRALALCLRAGVCLSITALEPCSMITAILAPSGVNKSVTAQTKIHTYLETRFEVFHGLHAV
jgi:hypothetical protein